MLRKLCPESRQRILYLWVASQSPSILKTSLKKNLSAYFSFSKLHSFRQTDHLHIQIFSTKLSYNIKKDCNETSNFVFVATIIHHWSMHLIWVAFLQFKYFSAVSAARHVHAAQCSSADWLVLEQIFTFTQWGTTSDM